MAEVLGPIGFCFGCISFILSTIPTAAKALDDFSRCVEHFRLYKVRLRRCKAKADKWNTYWRHKSDFGKHEVAIDDTRKDIEGLCRLIEDKIEKHMTDKRERKAWQCIAKELRRGQFRTLRAHERTMDFARSVGWVLFQKNVIEDWLKGFETAIDCIENLSEIEFAKRTAEHFPSSPNRAQVLETKRLEDFVKGVTTLARKVHDESTATAARPEPTTYGWGLGLRPPDPSTDVEHWKYIAKVHIEVRFSTSQSVADNRHFHLDIPFHKDDKKTHLSSEQVKNLVCGHTAPNLFINPSAPAAKCSTQHPRARRTRPIGDLLKHAPELFLECAWRVDRANLVQGLSHWVLLLWDTPWMEKLCCYGLQIEKGVIGKDCIVQIFNVGECPMHDGCHHDSRVRNLGLVLAQLILGKPIRWASDGDPKEYQQWIEGAWKVLYRSDIVAEVFAKTTSTPLCDAIDFCLEDESAIARERFQPGFLFECIEHIQKPLKEWIRTESLGLKSREESERTVSGVSQNERWPKEAMCQVWEAQQAEHVASECSTSLLDQRRSANRLRWKGLEPWSIMSRYLLMIIFSAAAVVSLLPPDIPFAWRWRYEERERRLSAGCKT